MDKTVKLTADSHRGWDDDLENQSGGENERGRKRYFMQRLVENLPAAERDYLASEKISLLDWGCAGGDGVDVLAGQFPACRVSGLELDERAAAEARRRFPRHEFHHAPEGTPDDRYDAIVAVCCLERFTDPLEVMRGHFRRCRDFYAALAPYREAPLRPGHLSQFREECFPERLDGFTRVAVKVVDGDFQGRRDKWIMVVYASATYFRERRKRDLQIRERRKWNDYYATLPMLEIDDAMQDIGHDLAQRIGELLPRGGKVLEAGCGAGWQSLVLAKNERLRLSLMDFSAEALRYAERIFAQHQQRAEFVEGDVFSIGEAEYDLVYNAGVLEHYTFDQQVAFLRGMASRSTKYVMAMVPNRMCYWYWLWRMQRSAGGNWPFGKEMPMSDMSAAFEAAGLRFLGHWFGGITWSDFFIRDLSGLDDRLRDEIMAVHHSFVVPEKQRAYLVAALGCKGNVPAVPSCWDASTDSSDFTIDQLTASLADSLAATVAVEHRRQYYESALLEKDKLIAAGGETTDSLQRELRQSAAEIARLNDELSRIKAAPVERDGRLPPKRIWSSARLRMAVRRRLLRIVRRMAPEGTVRNRYARAAAEKIRRLRNGPAAHSGLGLEQILREVGQCRGIVVYPPFIDWGWMRQRPHQLMAQFAKAGYLSLFCSPQRQTDSFRGFVRVAERLYLCDDPKPLYTLPNCLLLTGWSGWEQVKNFSRPAVIYDYLDDLGVAESWASQEYKQSRHRRLVSTSRVVLATARRLHDEVKRQRPDALYCPNGVDYDHFHLASPPPPPDDVADLVAAGRTIVGYYGALAHWFDYELVARAASLRKEWTFLLIGPDFDHSLAAHNLVGLPNVRWLGEKKYDELPAYLHHFSVATIPFLINDITRSTSPVKLFEYMAATKPIVTTDMPECRAQSCVMVAGNAEEYVAAIEEAARRGATDSYRRAVDEAARKNTWEARLQQIIDRLEALDAKERLQSA
ncbi:MAG: methyltransferase domain-containing protein [Pirellulales bacterium]|nr:methyltransferase domain-containing protein [Pirellulales bacterium]